jgi:Ca-activated chloride channel homolog
MTVNCGEETGIELRTKMRFFDKGRLNAVWRRAAFGLFVLICVPLLATAQVDRSPDHTRTVKIAGGGVVTITNRWGRVTVQEEKTEGVELGNLTINAFSENGVTDGEIKSSGTAARPSIEVAPARGKRIDIVVIIPTRASVKVETIDGAIDVAGDLTSIEAKSATGTIAVGIPVDEIRYSLTWTESRPRFVSDIDLEPVRERAAGRFEIRGRYRGPEASSDAKRVNLNLTTARGIILVNVPENEISGDLRERPMTEAAKAIIKSGDSLLTEAIRRASPKYFGDYSRTLPPVIMQPSLVRSSSSQTVAGSNLRVANVRVTDLGNRTITGLTAGDLELTESGRPVDVLSIERSTAPFNLVLLVDVSGSVENYVNFIRKAARAFVETVDANDRVSIVTFDDDIKVLSGFTTDRDRLSASLDSFDAGGGTALYDALAYTLADTLRPLKGERSAIVILSDGDDNRSFLAFDQLVGAIQESGSLIYPLYVPSGLLAASAAGADIDPMRKKYMSLSARSEGEGERLASISGGVFYKIDRVSDIQAAYEDIVEQLRSTYSIKYRSDGKDGGTPARLKVRVKRENSFATVLSVSSAER